MKHLKNYEEITNMDKEIMKNGQIIKIIGSFSNRKYNH